MEEDDSKDRIGYLLIGLAVILAGVLGFFVFRAKSNAVAIDPATNCPKSGPRGAVAFIFDLTDDLQPIQRSAIENDLGISEIETPAKGLVDSIPKFYSAGLFRVQDVAKSLPEFADVAICNPGDGSDLSVLNANPAFAKKRWKEVFQKQFRQKLDESLQNIPSKTSPILETIQAVSVRFLNRPELRGKPRRLIIVSDLLQNTEHYSQLKGVEPYETFRAGKEYLHLRTDLNGIEVSILYIRRRGHESTQGGKHIQFWQKYFEDMGAEFSSDIAVKSVEG